MIRQVQQVLKKVCQKVQVKNFKQPILRYQFSQNHNNNNKNDGAQLKNVFYEDIINEHSLNQKVQEIEKMNDIDQIDFLDTIVKKFNVDPKYISDYGDIIINNFLAKEDYQNVLKCCNIIVNFFNNKVSPQSQQLFSIYSTMCESYIKLNNKEQALNYISKAENNFNSNLEMLNKVHHEYFSHSHLLSIRFLDLGLYEKSSYYASLCLTIENIEIPKQSLITFVLIDSLINLNKNDEALQFGQNYLSKISFEEIGMRFDEMELEMLKVIFERVASLLIEQNKLGDAYQYQDQLLFLIEITEDEGSYKYEAVYNWRQENLYQLALQNKGDIDNILLEAEITKQKLLGVKQDQINKDIEERAQKLAQQIKLQYEYMTETINIHKQVYSISEQRFDVDNQFSQELQDEMLNLVKKSVELEEKLINVPLIDQYFVKNEFYKIKTKFSQQICNQIEKLLSKKK